MEEQMSICCEKKPIYKAKRDVFRFNGEKPTAVNLEYVTTMTLDGNKINFTFLSSGLIINLENEEIANNIFDKLLTIWSADVVA